MLNKKDYMRIDGMRVDGKTWTEIREILNKELGVNYDESAYRKPYTSYKKGVMDSVTDKEAIEALQRIEIEKKKLNVMRSANNEIIRDVALRELYQEQILEAIDNLPPLNYQRKRVLDVCDTDRDDIVVMSDLHYDGMFDLEEVLGYVLNKLIEHIEENNLRTIDIVELGDTIEGASLRPSQLRGIKTGMVSQIITVSEHYAHFLEVLHKETGVHIEFHAVTSSNHTQLRPLNSKRNELPDEDLMRVFYTFLKERFKDNDDVWINGGESLVVEISYSPTTRMYFGHGDKFGLTPANLVKTCKDIAMFEGVIYEYYGFGHFHQYKEEAINKVGNGVSKAFLFPALSPTKSSYERLGLMGCSPAFTILTFKNGVHEGTQLIRTVSYE